MTALSTLLKAKGHTLIVWNCRSLLPKIEEIERIKIETKCEFLGICETWLTDQIDDCQIQLDGYNHLRSDRTSASGKKSGGGLIMYYKNGLDCSALDEQNVCTPHIELTWVRQLLSPLLHWQMLHGNVPHFLLV